MNTSLKLNLDFKKLLPALRRGLPYIFGLAMIGVFGYTAYEVNGALNVEPADASTIAGASPTPAITFDKPTIEAVKKLDVVSGNVPAGDLGKGDPFK